MFRHSNTIAVCDSEVWKFIQAESDRQEQHIELIASENYTSPAVMQAQGSLLTNKYAEGYPGKRYYGGCQYVDEVERIAIERAKKLFCEPAGVEMAVNVQPHSGAQANEAVLFGLLNPGDTVMGMSLADGGHLTHGMHLNFSGRYFNIVSYGVRDDTEAIDYDEVERLAKEHQPKLIIAGASAYSLHIDFKRFADIARGLRIVSGGTQSHVMLVDLRPMNLTGKAAEALLGAAHITVNKNAIHNDPQTPFVTSGIRLGTPAMTTRGFKEEETRKVGNLIADLLSAPEDAQVLERVRTEVDQLTAMFPVYRP